MSLPVLIPATGRGRTAAPSGSSNPLEPPMRLELSADAPPPSRAAPVTELRVREVSNQPSPRAVPGSRPAAQAGATGVAARLVWTDAPRQAELHTLEPAGGAGTLHTLEPAGGAGTQDPRPASGQIDSAPASGQIDSAERGSENALAESNKTRKVQAAPRLRLVASKEPAGAAQLRLASFAPGGDHPASLGRDDSPGAPNEPLLKVRPAAHQGVADAGQRASELNVLRSKRLLVCEHEVIEALPEDPNVCRVFWESPGEIVVVGRNVGSTRLHFRLRDAACPTYTCLVRVVVAPDEGSSR